MENRLEHLNQVNDVPVHSVLDPEFASYGRVVTGYDFSEMIAYIDLAALVILKAVPGELPSDRKSVV